MILVVKPCSPVKADKQHTGGQLMKACCVRINIHGIAHLLMDKRRERPTQRDRDQAQACSPRIELSCALLTRLVGATVAPTPSVGHLGRRGRLVHRPAAVLSRAVRRGLG